MVIQYWHVYRRKLKSAFIFAGRRIDLKSLLVILLVPRILAESFNKNIG